MWSKAERRMLALGWTGSGVNALATGALFWKDGPWPLTLMVTVFWVACLIRLYRRGPLDQVTRR